MQLKSDVKFEEKLTLGSTDMSKLVNFNVCSGKSQNVHLYVLLLSIAYKVSARKPQKKLSLMPLKKDPKFEEKLTFRLKNYMKNSVNFHLNSGKPKNLPFDELLL